MRTMKYWLLGAGFTTCCSVALADQDSINTMDLEALMSLDVQATSVMKRVESVIDTPASVYVLTADQINLSGATTLTEAVSLLPGLFYREMSNSQRAVGIRQTPDQLSLGFLLMIDGRYVYNPIFPGTIWEHLEIPLGEIERIELIRGSAGTLWSSKASNGVINIITSHSIDTQGFEVTLGTGTRTERKVNLRYGGLFGDGGSYRINLGTQKIDRSADFAEPAHDGQQVDSFSTRMDYTFSDDLSLMVKASYLDSDSEITTNKISAPLYQGTPWQNNTVAEKTNLMLRLDQRLSATRSQMLQFAYSDGSAAVDDLDGNLELLNLNYSMNTEFARHKLDWGLEYQQNKAFTVENDFIMIEGDGHSRLDNFGGFIQNEVELIADQTFLIGAVRADKDAISGWEYQPSLRLMHKLTPEHRLWGGVSRSVLTPTDYSTNITLRVPTPDPLAGVQSFLVGSPDFDAEKFDNYELGYRGQFDDVEVDLSLFYIESDNAVSLENEVLGAVVPFPPFFIPSQINGKTVNGAHLVKQGGELLINLQPLYNWSLQLSFNYLDQQNRANRPEYLPLLPSMIQKQVAIRSDYRHTSSLSSYIKVAYQNGFTDNLNVAIDGYTTVDAGLTWQVNPDLELGLYVQNLFDPSHPEFASGELTNSYTTEIERDVYARAVWTF
ncbi:TonB-dependent receptor plug domain-containing protein [Amphritea sp. HPY]|uniref:TonB-dependent receptor plug domain-containing protein n=1 Tax=Amphritea sp. HPY TaxID=3421652 RepID=UPI003D7E736E